MHKIVAHGFGTFGPDQAVELTAEEKEEWEKHKKAGDAELPDWCKGLVKKTAQKKINSIMPEWKQRNLLAQSAILQDKGRENWTSAELKEWEDGETQWNKVKVLRAKSNDLELIIDDSTPDQLHSLARNIVNHSIWD